MEPVGDKRRIELFIVSGCNISCGFCCESTRNRSPGFMSLAEAESKLRAARDTGARVVQFMGGEPSLHPEFPALLTLAKELGLSTFTITNLLAWEDPAFAEAVGPVLDDVMYSVHAFDAHSGYLVTGRQRWYERFRIAAANADRTLVGMRQASTVLSRQNVEGLDALASLVLSLRPKRWVLGNPVPVLNTRMDAVDMGLSLSEQRALMPKLLEISRRVRAAGTDLVTFCIPNCVADPQLGAMTHDGLLGEEQDISDQAPATIDDVNFWAQADYRQEGRPVALGRQRPRPCDDCVERDACGGYFTEYFRRHGTAELRPVGAPRERPVILPPRRIHLYGVGIAKTGSTSLSQIFAEYRTDHEHRFQQTAEFLWDWQRSGADPESLRTFVRERDADELEVDSSTLNHFLVPAIREVFPEARFLVTVRDPCSQLDSFANMMQWNRARMLQQPGGYPAWHRQIGEVCFGAFDPDDFADSETIRRRLPDLMDRHLTYWAQAYRGLLETLPAEQSLFLPTFSLSHSLDRIAAFVGVPEASLVRSHGNARPVKEAFAIAVPDLEERVARICGDVLAEVLPDWSVDAYRARVSARRWTGVDAAPVRQGGGERARIDRGWFYVNEPEDGLHAPPDRLLVAGDGTVLTRRLHGSVGRIAVRSDRELPVAALLRAAHAVDRNGYLKMRLTAGEDRLDDGEVVLGDQTGASYHLVAARVKRLLQDRVLPAVPLPGVLPEKTTPRALFFESLMNSDMPHNDQELSQGVLHMISPLSETETEVVLVNAKMSIEGEDRLADVDLARLEAALAGGPIGLVCITVLEGYYEGVTGLIRTLRDLGCRAHIAVGGVMPTLAPEHVAAHLSEVSFVCRGAGEYFVPALVRILGDTDVDQPLSDAQRYALLQLDGLIAIERAGGRVTGLLSANSAHTVKVEDLDRVPLDLRYLQKRHVEAGIEITTSRGCIHKCTFCSILGREDYQARSSDSVIDLLCRYATYFEALFGPEKPPDVWRVHIADDDFACDRERAKTLFTRIPETPFKLTSVQVSIADLCRREGGVLLPEPDHTLLDAVRPELFADHGKPIPVRDHVADHKSRNWSSYLQIGVETYSDRELIRLGKGYRIAHVRAIVAELARRRVHMDGYFILSNADTTASDLVDVFEELSRLKLTHPVHFHMRFPVVPHLVSFFTSASHRRLVRQGRTRQMVLRGKAAEPGYPEFDYPFVDHDASTDPLVQRAVTAGFVTDVDYYTDNLRKLRELWRDDAPESLLRRLDDAPRRLVFGVLAEALDGGGDAELALQVAINVLGPRAGWIDAFKRFRSPEAARIRVRSGADLERALTLLQSTSRAEKVIEVEGAFRTHMALHEAHPEVRFEPVEAAASLRDPVAPGELFTLLPGVRYGADDLKKVAEFLFAGAILRPPPALIVEADGTLHDGTFPIGHLDDLHNLDRYWLDGQSARLDRGVRKVLESYGRWRGRNAS